MHTGGASTLAIPFCRRASRSNAEGMKTEGESVCLLSRSGGRSMILAYGRRFSWARLRVLGAAACNVERFGIELRNEEVAKDGDSSDRNHLQGTECWREQDAPHSATGVQRAAALARAFLIDLARTIEEAAATVGCTGYAVCSPDSAAAELAAFLPSSFDYTS